MDKFLFLVVTSDGTVTRRWGTNLDVKKIWDADDTAVVIRGNQEVIDTSDSVHWTDIPEAP